MSDQVTESPKATGTRRERSMIGAARIVACLLGFLGLISLLRTGSTGDTKDVAGFTVHPLTAVVWLVIGIVGIAMSVEAVRARLYLIGTGALLVLWALVAILTGGGASDAFTTDWTVLTLHLVLGLGALGVAFGPTPDFVEKALALPDAAAETEEAPQDEPLIKG